jgi:hypothetical protein
VEDAEGLGEAEPVGDAEGDGVPLELGEGDGLGDGDVVALGEGVGVGDGVGTGPGGVPAPTSGWQVVTADCTSASKPLTARCTPEVSTFGGLGERDRVADDVGVEPDREEGAADAAEPDAEEEPAEVVADEVVEGDVELDPAASKDACAATRFACATVTARSRSAVSRVASTSPASTSSPTDTLTVLTVPAVRKDAVTWSTRSTDPDSEIDWVTEPVSTVAVRSPDVAAELGTASTTR